VLLEQNYMRSLFGMVVLLGKAIFDVKEKPLIEKHTFPKFR
jgi:hypothetical protein